MVDRNSIDPSFEARRVIEVFMPLIYLNKNILSGFFCFLSIVQVVQGKIVDHWTMLFVNTLQPIWIAHLGKNVELLNELVIKNS